MLSNAFKALTIATILFSNHAIAQLTDNQNLAKVQGISLFNQYKTAEPELRIAAEAGDAEAQFYLAEELRLQKQRMTTESLKWYEASASQGNYYAMYKLSRSDSDLCAVTNQCPVSSKKPNEWQALLMATAKPLALRGDGEAMAFLYDVTADLGWLEKSSEAGYARGKWLLATRYAEGEGTFFFPWKRSSAQEELLKEAAKGGFPKAMMEYSTILQERNDLPGVRYWLEAAANTGYVNAVSTYGGYIAHTPDKVGYPINLIKGYALTSLLQELDGGGNIQAYVEVALPEIAKKMTAAEIDEAKKYAIEWKATHPPLSFFPEKLGF